MDFFLRNADQIITGVIVGITCITFEKIVDHLIKKEKDTNITKIF